MVFNASFEANIGLGAGSDNASYPFSAFNFSIEISVDPVATRICSAAFSECDGLEMNIEVKTIRQGGDNARQIRLAGPGSFGNLTLKRGMTSNFDLWDWFNAVVLDPSLRADAEIVMLAPDRSEQCRFLATRCLPIKLKAPPLNALSGAVAVEEMQLAYETLQLKRPDGAGGGGGLGISAGVSVGSSVSASAGISLG
jgi:phage tail-like protein